MKHVHIAIPVHNQVDYLRQCLQSIERTTRPAGKADPRFPEEEYDVTVHVIDSGSSDIIGPVVVAEIPERPLLHAKFTRLQQNPGVTIPWNIGLKDAMDHGADIICICNSDVIFGPNLIKNCAAALKEVGACWPLSKQGGPLEVDFDQKAEKAGQRRVYLNGSERTIIDTGGFAGWCFFLSRKTVEKVGMFDEQFTLWYQDTDYHNRLHLSEVPHGEIHACYLHHFESRTIVSMPNGFDCYGWRRQDEQRYFKKYPKS